MARAAIVRFTTNRTIDLYALHERHDRLVMIEGYEPELVRSEHAKGAALAGLLSAVEGKLNTRLEQPSRRAGPGTAPGRKRPKRAHCDRSLVNNPSTEIDAVGRGINNF